MISSFLIAGIVFSFGVPLASAAAPAGSMACTAMSLATASVTGANNSNTITITSSGTEITAANDIFIRIPSTVNARFDTTDTTVGITQSSSGVTSTTVTYPVNDKTVKLAVDTNFASGENVQITGLSILADAVTSAIPLVWAIDNTTEGSATFSSTSSCTLAVTATDANASISLSSVVVGATQNTTISFLLSVQLAANDTITFTAPGELDVTNIASAVVTGTLEAAGQVTCAAVAQAVTCTIDGSSGPGGVVRTIILTGGVTGKFAGTGDASNFAINDASATPAGADINTDADTVVAMPTTTVGTLTSVSYTPSSTANTSLVSYTVAFTTVGTTMANGAKIVIVFPSGYDLTGMNTSTSSLSGLDGTWTASRSSQTVTLTQSGGGTTSPGAKSLVLTNVRNPSATGATAAFTMTTRTSADADIQTEAAATVSITAGTTTSTELDDITGISVEDNSDGEGVMITWDDPSGDDTSYIQILKGTDPLPVSGTIYATVAVGTEYYIDTDVEEGDVVTYQLRATDGSDTGDLSDEVSFTVGSGETVVSDDTDDEDTSEDTSEDTTDDESTEDTDDTEDEATEEVSFSDISGHWGENAIEAMAEDGIVEGYEDGTFAPNGNLNRAEAAAMLWRVLAMGEPTEATEDPFSDVDMAEWYAAYIAGLADLDLVDGNPDGTYQPSEEINRAEFLQLAVNVYLYLYEDMVDDADALMAGTATGAYEDLDTAAWYEGAVTVATAWDFVQGSACDGGMCFNAGDSISRAEATQILYNMFADAM